MTSSSELNVKAGRGQRFLGGVICGAFLFAFYWFLASTFGIGPRLACVLAGAATAAAWPAVHSKPRTRTSGARLSTGLWVVNARLSLRGTRNPVRPLILRQDGFRRI